jgi:hypothetical protein
VVQYGVEAARKKSFLVEQSHDVVLSFSYQSVREFLNQRLESEAAKMLENRRLERVSGTGGAGNSVSGSISGGVAADG